MPGRHSGRGVEAPVFVCLFLFFCAVALRAEINVFPLGVFVVSLQYVRRCAYRENLCLRVNAGFKKVTDKREHLPGDRHLCIQRKDLYGYEK